jgi:hypothetical protein
MMDRTQDASEFDPTAMPPDENPTDGNGDAPPDPDPGPPKG